MSATVSNRHNEPTSQETKRALRVTSCNQAPTAFRTVSRFLLFEASLPISPSPHRAPALRIAATALSPNPSPSPSPASQGTNGRNAAGRVASPRGGAAAPSPSRLLRFFVTPASPPATVWIGDVADRYGRDPLFPLHNGFGLCTLRPQGERISEILGAILLFTSESSPCLCDCGFVLLRFASMFLHIYADDSRRLGLWTWLSYLGFCFLGPFPLLCETYLCRVRSIVYLTWFRLGIGYVRHRLLFPGGWGLGKAIS